MKKKSPARHSKGMWQDKLKNYVDCKKTIVQKVGEWTGGPYCSPERTAMIGAFYTPTSQALSAYCTLSVQSSMGYSSYPDRLVPYSVWLIVSLPPNVVGSGTIGRMVNFLFFSVWFVYSIGYFPRGWWFFPPPQSSDFTFHFFFFCIFLEKIFFFPLFYIRNLKCFLEVMYDRGGHAGTWCSTVTQNSPYGFSSVSDFI